MTTRGAVPSAVLVEAPARLHFGMLDLSGAAGRRFGGIGAAVPEPGTSVELHRAARLDVAGPGAGRAEAFARRFLAHHGLGQAATIIIRRTTPPHAGLGSGTQLALAVARGLAELYGLPTEAAGLARAVGRARRSAIGTFLFAGGGFVLEGGRRDGADHPAPLLARYALPAQWRCVLVLPPGQPGVSGETEDAAFAALPEPPDEEARRVAHLVLMALLPALVEHDIHAFGRALTAIQCINGRWFAPVQGGAFASPAGGELAARLAEWGAAGVGQSSWGPALYGIVDGDTAAVRLADRARAFLGADATILAGAFCNEGARVRPLADPP